MLIFRLNLALCLCKISLQLGEVGLILRQAHTPSSRVSTFTLCAKDERSPSALKSLSNHTCAVCADSLWSPAPAPLFDCCCCSNAAACVRVAENVMYMHLRKFAGRKQRKAQCGKVQGVAHTVCSHARSKVCTNVHALACSLAHEPAKSCEISAHARIAATSGVSAAIPFKSADLRRTAPANRLSDTKTFGPEASITEICASAAVQSQPCLNRLWAVPPRASAGKINWGGLVLPDWGGLALPEPSDPGC